MKRRDFLRGAACVPFIPFITSKFQEPPAGMPIAKMIPSGDKWRWKVDGKWAREVFRCKQKEDKFLDWLPVFESGERRYVRCAFKPVIWLPGEYASDFAYEGGRIRMYGPTLLIRDRLYDPSFVREFYYLCGIRRRPIPYAQESIVL